MNRNKIFLAITLLIPVFFFAFLEVGLRLGDYRGNLSLFELMRWQNKDYLKLNYKYAQRYFFKLEMPPAPGNDIFLAEKPDSTLRFFVLGGSSTAGYPFGHNGMFSRLTRDMLLESSRGFDIEVINVSMSAINTYTLVDQVREILDHSPDGILFYTGHNEYYGALGVGSVESLGVIPGFVRFFLRIQEFKTFLLVRDIVTKISVALASNKIDQSKTLMERVVKERFIPYKSDVYYAGIYQFESNMNAMVSMIRKKNVPVWISTIGSNLRDHFPFESITSDHFPKADETYRSAKDFYTIGQFDSAQVYFELAKELDALRFRAPNEINATVKKIASENEGVFLVDAHQALQENAENGIPGRDLFLEHLHPTQFGNAIIGYEFGKKMLEYPEFSPFFEASNIGTLQDYQGKMYLTEYDNKVVYHRLRSLMGGWPFTKTPSQNHYKFNYVPNSIADSMAFQHVHGSLPWAKGKVELAEYYLKVGERDKSLAEYYGLIRDDPSNDSPKIFATRILLDQNRFDEALPLLEDAHKLNPSSYTTKMIGILEITRGNTKKAIAMLEKVKKITPNDPQVLYNLSGAYGLIKDYQKADQILFELEQLSPNFPGIREWRQELNAAMKRKANG